MFMISVDMLSLDELFRVKEVLVPLLFVAASSFLSTKKNQHLKPQDHEEKVFFMWFVYFFIGCVRK